MISRRRTRRLVNARAPPCVKQPPLLLSGPAHRRGLVVATDGGVAARKVGRSVRRRSARSYLCDRKQPSARRGAERMGAASSHQKQQRPHGQPAWLLLGGSASPGATPPSRGRLLLPALVLAAEHRRS